MTDLPALQVWIISPFKLLNQSFASLLNGLPGLSCLGHSETFSSYPEVRPDLVLHLLPSPGDLSPFENLRTQHPTQSVLLFALNWTAAEARAALQAGAAGCLSADMPVEAFAAALRQAARREIALPAALQQAIILEMARGEFSAEKVEIVLSPREQEVLALVVNGLSNKAIAQRLYLSVRTVENHLARIYQKLDVRSRTEAAVLALQAGWVEPD